MSDAPDPLAGYPLEYLEQVIDTKTYAREQGISIDTAYEQAARGFGPPRFKVSPGKYGYRRRQILLHQLRQQAREEKVAA